MTPTFNFRPMFRSTFRCVLAVSTAFPFMLIAQDVQWLRMDPQVWSMNPSYATSALHAQDVDHVYEGRLDEVQYIYGQYLLGTSTVARLDANGNALWSIPLGDTVVVQSITSDAAGNVVVGGRFFGQFKSNGIVHFTLPIAHASPGTFLCAWDANGQALWQQDVSGGVFDDIDVAALTVDPQGHVWAALSTFFGADVVRLAADGSIAETRELTDSKQVGSISFDPWGGLYVSGAATLPSIGINGTTYPVNEQYAFYVTRMNAAGDAQWLQYAHDITFQRPRVVADASGYAYLIGSPFDTLSWGGLNFQGPEWNSTFFLTRLDSMGVFHWGVQTPQNGFLGQFEIAQNKSVAVDGDNNVYVLGIASGQLDWGNGVLTNLGTNQNQGVSLLSFDASGSPLWTVDGGSTSFDVAQDLAVTDAGSCFLIGTTGASFTFGPFTEQPAADRGTYVVRVDAQGSVGVGDASTNGEEVLAYPAPFNTSFRLRSALIADGTPVTVTLTDATGRMVEQAVRMGQEMGAGLAAGTYALRIVHGNRTFRTRVLKQ